jgi:NAD(P)-dependent dehydrogenase (short-subunit alcohol dehydrogenase family)
VGELTGRVQIITGGSAGVGAAAARALGRRDATLVLVGRSGRRLARVADRIEARTGRRPTVEQADFASFTQVRDLAARILSRYPRLHLLANNAGALIGLRHATQDGFERTIQVNHLSPFLLTGLLLPALRAGAADGFGPSRVISTSSLAEAVGAVDPDNLSWKGVPYSRWAVYAASKQANILFTVEAARRWDPAEVVATCFHPGLVRSRFGAASASFLLGKLTPVALPPSLGARGLVHLATHPDGVTRPGEYFFWRWPTGSSPNSRNPALAAALWTASEAAVSDGDRADRPPDVQDGQHEPGQQQPDAGDRQ